MFLDKLARFPNLHGFGWASGTGVFKFNGR